MIDHVVWLLDLLVSCISHSGLQHGNPVWLGARLNLLILSSYVTVTLLSFLPVLKSYLVEYLHKQRKIAKIESSPRPVQCNTTIFSAKLTHARIYENASTDLLPTRQKQAGRFLHR